MLRLIFAPDFTDFHGHCVNDLLDFFLIRHLSDVPVKEITIYFGEESATFPVDGKTYRTALFLLYCAVLSRSTGYEWKDWLRDYLSGLITDEAARVEARILVHLIQRKVTRVVLTLRPGYDLPNCKGRTAHELITYAWERRDDLTAESPVPLIRLALLSFARTLNDGYTSIIQNDDPDSWPSRCWVRRINELFDRLGIPLQVTRT